MIEWPKDIVCWNEGDGKGGVGRQCMSIPFTWLLPKAKRYIESFPGVWIVGGPAVRLMPDYLSGLCEIGTMYPGVLQRINPLATRTTEGCPNHCSFCGVKKISLRGFRQYENWPDLPIICDDNLLAADYEHFEEVCFRLQDHGWCDFNQGLDARLLTPWHALRIAKIKKPIVRLALDNDATRGAWATAVDYLRTAGVAVRNIRSYVLCGHDGHPELDWGRCEFVESYGIKALPMWYHRLDCLHYGEVTEAQQSKGWTKEKQRQLMRWYYKHSGKKLIA
jgi:hypothetical protein